MDAVCGRNVLHLKRPRIQCTDDIITAINEAIKQRESTSPNEFDIDGVNEDTKYISALL